MHTVVWLKDYDDDGCRRLIEIAQSRGLGLYPIKPHYLKHSPRPGLLLGYAGVSLTDIDKAMRLFGECLESVASSSV
jgi:GntR family transcriptional regulator/MocR family aminotransferase